MKTLKWYSAEDAEVCKSCATFHGVIVNINENFIVKGEQPINMNARTASDGGMFKHRHYTMGAAVMYVLGTLALAEDDDDTLY